MPLSRHQRRFVRGVVYSLVFLSFAVSAFFFVRMLYRGHKADLKARHARLHAGMTESDIIRAFGPSYGDSEFPNPLVGERELGRPLPPDGVQLKSWPVGREWTFCAYLSGDGEVLKVTSLHSADQRTWIERRIDELLE